MLRSLFFHYFFSIAAKRPSVTLQSDIFIRKEKDVYIHKCENSLFFCVFVRSFFAAHLILLYTKTDLYCCYHHRRHCCCCYYCNFSPFTDISAVFFRSNLFLDLKFFIFFLLFFFDSLSMAFFIMYIF